MAQHFIWTLMTEFVALTQKLPGVLIHSALLVVTMLKHLQWEKEQKVKKRHLLVSLFLPE